MKLSIASRVAGIGLGCAATLAFAAPANATDTAFASFSPTGQAANIKLVNAGNSSSRLNDGTLSQTTVGSQAVKFSFLDQYLGTYVNDVVANYTLTTTIAKNSPVTTIQIAGLGNMIVQTGVSGSLSFISTTAISVAGPNFVPHTYAAGSNLLSLVFSNASISGFAGGNSLAFGASTQAGGTLTYTSDFLDFSDVINRSFNYTLSSTTPGTAAATGANKSLKSFAGVSSGLFGSDPAALVNGAVPEPATWLMMIVGFGGIGIGLRGRRKQGAFAVA